MNLPNNLTPTINFLPYQNRSEIENLQQSIEEIEINVKPNYNSMVSGQILEFKNQLDRNYHSLIETEQKITFMMHTNRDSSITIKLMKLQGKINTSKTQLSLLLRMYDLQSKLTANKE